MPDDRSLAARSLLKSSGLEAFIVQGKTNIRYLSGFTGSDAMLAFDSRGQWLLCDSRYKTQAEGETSGCEIRKYQIKLDGLVELVKKQGWKRVGFDAEQTSFMQFRSMSEALPGLDLVPMGRELDDLRGVKSPDEIRSVEASCYLASSAFRAGTGY
jgi:Xaa-Pro aminopeptidase